MTIWFATGNIHKKEELAGILLDAESAADVEIKIPKDTGLMFAPEETGKSFLENALQKAGELYRLLKDQDNQKTAWQHGDPVIADDSGICIDALGGRPGIYSARYGGKVTDTERNILLLGELGGTKKRKARFVCAMVLYYGPDRFFAAQEFLEGELVQNAEAARGSGGFGYDPIFWIPELRRTVAELSENEKNRISHRGKAGKAIAKILSGKIFTDA
jgi:XTP/dITP diphosphohydrolase